MSNVPDSRPEGERRKGRALGLFELYRRAVLRRARRALIDVALERGAVTIDAVRERVPLPPDMDPRVFGAAPGELARGGILRRARYVQTGRPVGHARPVSEWVLHDAHAAVRWRHENPDLPDPAPPAGPHDYQI